MSMGQIEDNSYVETLAELLIPRHKPMHVKLCQRIQDACFSLYRNFYYQIFQIVVALFSCAFYISETYGYYHVKKWGVPWTTYAMVYSVTGIFLTDYLIGVIGAKIKLRHIFRWSSLSDILSIMPGILLLIYNMPFLEFLMLLRLVRASYIIRLHRMSVIAETTRKRTSVGLENEFYAMTAAEQTLDFTRNALSLGLTVICTVFIGTGVVFYLQVMSDETDFSDDDATPGRHLYFHEALYFVIITLATVGYGDITPIKPHARMVMSFFLVLFLSFVPYYSIELVKSLDNYSAYLGRYWTTKGVKHIILTGTINFENVDKFLSEIFLLEDFGNFKIVILSPTEPDFQLLAVIRSSRFKPHTIFLKGSPLNVSDLDRAAAKSAFGIVLLTKRAYKNPKQEDTKLLYQAVSISSYLGQPSPLDLSEMFRWPKVSMVVNRPQCITQVRALGIGKVISRDLIKLSCFAKSVLHPGLGALVANLVKSPEISKAGLLDSPWYVEYYRGISKQIYAVHFPPIFYGIAFSEAVARIYMLFELIVIGVESSESGKVSLNPGPKYEIDDGDVAFVIAYSKEHAQELEKHRLSFSMRKNDLKGKRVNLQTKVPRDELQQEAKKCKPDVFGPDLLSYGTELEHAVPKKGPQRVSILQMCRKQSTTVANKKTVEHCKRHLSIEFQRCRTHSAAAFNRAKVQCLQKQKQPSGRHISGTLQQSPRETGYSRKKEVNSFLLPKGKEIKKEDIEEMSGSDLRSLLQAVKNHSLKPKTSLDGQQEDIFCISTLIKTDISQMSASDARETALCLTNWLNINLANLKYSAHVPPEPSQSERNKEFLLPSADAISNHVVIIGMPCSPTHIELFLHPIVGKVPVIFLVRYKEENLMHTALEEVKISGQVPLHSVFYVVGSPTSRRRLLRAGIDRCSAMVLLNPKGALAPAKTHKEDKENPDAETLLCFLKARPLIRRDCNLMVELVKSMSLRYLRACDAALPPLLRGGSSMHHAWPFFASGKVYTCGWVKMLLAKAVFNSSMIAVLEQLLGIASSDTNKFGQQEYSPASFAATDQVTGATGGNSKMPQPSFTQENKQALSRESFLLNDQITENDGTMGSSILTSMAVPKAFYHHSFGELFQELIAPPLNIIAVGLYRSKGTKEASEPYVYTAPQADTILLKTDKVFILTNNRAPVPPV